MLARVLIISDRIAKYGDFQSQLKQYPEYSIWVLDAADLRFFERDPRDSKPELIILDVMASQTKCLAALARVRALFADAKIAVRAQNSWEPFLPLILQAGAHGIIDASTYRSKEAMSLLIESIMAGNIIYRVRRSE